MNPEIQKKINEIICETNDKISSMVDEIRNIQFSKMKENEKQIKCDEFTKQHDVDLIMTKTKLSYNYEKQHYHCTVKNMFRNHLVLL
jgi:hypothetical protein